MQTFSCMEQLYQSQVNISLKEENGVSYVVFSTMIYWDQALVNQSDQTSASEQFKQVKHPSVNP